MEHAEATKTKAAERYVLGEMADPEAEAFEEHYFDCSVCANDIRDEMKVLEWGREVAREERRPARVVPLTRRRLGEWLPLVAAAVFVIGIGVPMATRSVDRATSVEKARALVLQTGGTRGPIANVVTLAKDETLLLSFDVPHDPQSGFTRYALAVRDAGGKMHGPRSVTAREVEEGEAVNLVLRELPAGACELTVDGVGKDGSRTTVIRQSFNVQR